MLACARINALDTELVSSTIIADATLELMGNQNGLDLIAPFAHVLKTLLGSVMLLTLIISTHGLSAQTKVFVIDQLVNASASLVMKELLANVLFALITVTTVELAGQKSTSLPELNEHIALHGML